MDHISQSMLEQFIEGKAARWEVRQIVVHLLRGCDSCAALAVGTFRPAVAEQTYDDIFDRVTRRLVTEWGSIELPALGKVSACSSW